MPRTASSNTSDTPSKTQLTPDDWIRAAAEVLVDKSVDAVRVEVLSKNLGVTRGSFYWHFKDRGELLGQVLHAWRRGATEQVSERFSQRHADPQQLVREIISLPFRGRSALRAARVELAIRDWARRDPTARQAVDEADASRISYIAQCFSALGFGIAEARHRASVLYAYEVGESLLAHQGSAAHKAERSELAVQLLLTPLKKP